jgi:hypothetical protein
LNSLTFQLEYYGVHTGPTLGSDSLKKIYMRKIFQKIVNFSILSRFCGICLA